MNRMSFDEIINSRGSNLIILGRENICQKFMMEWNISSTSTNISRNSDTLTKIINADYKARMKMRLENHKMVCNILHPINLNYCASLIQLLENIQTNEKVLDAFSDIILIHDIDEKGEYCVLNLNDVPFKNILLTINSIIQNKPMCNVEIQRGEDGWGKLFNDFLNKFDCGNGEYYGEHPGTLKNIHPNNGFENDIFVVSQYNYDLSDDENMYGEHPNFWYKPTDYRITWYKYPFRSSFGNQELTTEQFKEILNDCLNSMIRDGLVVEESKNLTINNTLDANEITKK